MSIRYNVTRGKIKITCDTWRDGRMKNKKCICEISDGKMKTKNERRSDGRTKNIKVSVTEITGK